MDDRITIEMSGAGLSFSGSVTLKQAVEMLRIASLRPDEVVAPTTVPTNTTESTAAAVALSLPEVLNSAQPSTSPETMTVIAAWLMDTEGTDFVTRAEIAARYQEARLPPPGNLPRDFAKAVQKGFLAPVRGSKDQFYVTRTGRQLLGSKERV